MADTVSLRIAGGSVTFDSSGLELAPWFSRRRVRIPWRNVMFVSPVPAVKRKGREWHTFQGEVISPATLRRDLNFYCFSIALNDRHAVLTGTSLFTKMWLLLTVWLKPLYMADDKPHPSNGCITLDFRKRWIRENGNALLAALETVERYSKFDLLIIDD
jgi:hypothetical protein